MAKVIMLSKVFLKDHPRAGNFTNFERKWKDGIKKHTIRAGNRFKVGDMFSVRQWIGQPYKSKQRKLGPDEEVIEIHRFTCSDNGTRLIHYLNGKECTKEQLEQLAANDALRLNDFLDWFDKPFTGQVICREKMNYA